MNGFAPQMHMNRTIFGIVSGVSCSIKKKKTIAIKKKLVKIIFFVKLIQVRENSYSHFEMVISTTPDINKNRGGCIVSYLGPNHLPKYLFLGYVLKS